MARHDKIKLFKFNQKLYQEIGAFPPAPDQNHSSVNSKKWFFLLALTYFLIPLFAYVVFEANSMFEYGFLFVICSSIILNILFYLMIIWQTENILSFIENCENFIEKS